METSLARGMLRRNIITEMTLGRALQWVVRDARGGCAVPKGGKERADAGAKVKDPTGRRRGEPLKQAKIGR